MAQLVNIFSVFCGTGEFISLFARAHHLFLFWARWNRPTYLLPLTSVLYSPFDLVLCIPSDLFQIWPTKNFPMHLSAFIRTTTTLSLILRVCHPNNTNYVVPRFSSLILVCLGARILSSGPFPHTSSPLHIFKYFVSPYFTPLALASDCPTFACDPKTANGMCLLNLPWKRQEREDIYYKLIHTIAFSWILHIIATYEFFYVTFKFNYVVPPYNKMCSLVI